MKMFATLTALIKTAALLFLLLLTAVQVRAQSALDGFDPNVNGLVFVVVIQPDGKILIGGDFTTLSPNGGAAVTRNHIARLNPDGTLDTAFNPNANGNVLSIAVQADGKILAGGLFNGANSIGGQTRNYIARLDATTGLADSLNPNANDVVESIAVQADGKILAGGYFTSIGGQTRNHIARLDATTGLADSLNPNANDVVFSIAVQVGGKILAGGNFTSIGGQTRNHIARLDATTGLADSFNPNANAVVESIAVQADGKILAGGVFNSIGGQTRNFIARLDATTGLADSFDPSANLFVISIAVQADGKILASGYFTFIGGQTRNHIARLETDGSLSLTSAVSRKIHGSAGTFDISLPLTGEPGVEDRSSGGSYTLVFTFSSDVVSGSASVTAGTGSVSGSPVFAGNTMTVNLTGVTDVQKITVTLTNVTSSDSQVLPATPVSINVLAGDTTADKKVNNADVRQTRDQVGIAVTTLNFREDVDVNGSISKADVSLVKSEVGHSLP